MGGGGENDCGGGGEGKDDVEDKSRRGRQAQAVRRMPTAMAVVRDTAAAAAEGCGLTSRPPCHGWGVLLPPAHAA